MASSFAIADIKADVARLANLPAFSASTNITDSQVTYWIVQAGRSLSALLRSKLGEDNDFMLTATLNVQAGLNFTSLPTDCGEVSAVLWAKTSTDYYLLEAAGIDELEMADTPEEPWECPPKYRIEGQVLSLYPASTEAESLLVYYTTHLNLTGQTTFLSRLDSDRWLTLDVLCRVLSSTQRDNSMYLQDKMLLEQEFLSYARRRDVNGTGTIRDTRRLGADRALRGRWRY